MTSPPILEFRHVEAYRGDTRVFADLSLSITAGEHTAILGPNGAGKSTLLKLISRDIYHVPHDHSVVRLFGRERWNVWDLRGRLGIVSHDLQHEYHGSALGRHVVLSGYYASIDVWDHQGFTGLQQARAAEIMEELGIAHLCDRRFAEMSVGEQRRCLMGRALIHDPGVLILDEPTSGLDLSACFQYIECIRKLTRRGKTIVLVTHHIHEIPPEIGRVMLIKQGRILDDGPKVRVLNGEQLSGLFDIPIELVQMNGFYQALPKGH